MDDLISRKAAIDALGKRPEAEWEEGWVAAPIGEYKQWLFAYHAILSTPSTRAVPLDKLCEWLSESFVNIPCEYCQYFSNQHCTAIGDMNKPCPKSADSWRNTITKWMEEQDAKEG